MRYATPLNSNAHLARIAAKGAEERAVAVHHNEPVLIFTLKQLTERLCVKFVVAQVQRRVDGLEWLEVDVDFLFLALVCQNGPRVQHKPVGRHLDDVGTRPSMTKTWRAPWSALPGYSPAWPAPCCTASIAAARR